jgi:hypothetical protein
MQKYINDEMQCKEEKIIDMCHADVNTNVVEKIALDDDILPWDPNFVPRILILTSQELKVMKDIPKKYKCSKCPSFALCPTGPYVDFSIKLENIETLINFPQLP